MHYGRTRGPEGTHKSAVGKASCLPLLVEALSDGLQGKPHKVTLVNTEVAQHLAARANDDVDPSGMRPQTPRDVATLQVGLILCMGAKHDLFGDYAAAQIKSEDGLSTYILKIRFHDTVGDIRKCLNEHRLVLVSILAEEPSNKSLLSRNSQKAFRMFTTFPRKVSLVQNQLGPCN